MKQFARCTNCRQWYVRHAITTVEIVQNSGLQRTTLWCVRCIRNAEHRSLSLEDIPDRQSAPSVAIALHTHESAHHTDSTEEFQQFIQEHLDLMERALHEDDAVIIALIDDFMQRCRTYQEQLQVPDQAQRLAGHLQYWETFLNTLNQSR